MADEQQFAASCPGAEPRDESIQERLGRFYEFGSLERDAQDCY
jgi:hypothetical protein